MEFGKFSLEEYKKKAREFHGTLAPGMLIGGYMVSRAWKELPEEGFFDVIAESSHCLPDAVQLLTPCSIGNGWLKIEHTGRFAIAFFNKETGEGVRVFLDSEKIKAWDEINTWFFKLKPKMEQDSEKLFSQIIEAGESLLSVQKVRVEDRFLEKKKKGGANGICPSCKEAYPLKDGDTCLACQGKLKYTLI